MNVRLSSIPPGRNSRSIAVKVDSLLSPSIRRSYPIAFSCFYDNYLKDADGNLLIDFDSGLGRIILKPSREDVKRVILDAVASSIYCYPTLDYYGDVLVEFLDSIYKISPIKPCRIHIVSSSWEACEEALKLAVWHTRRPIIAVLDGCWFGGGVGGINLSSKPRIRLGVHLQPIQILDVPYPKCSNCPFKMSHPDCNLYCVEFFEECTLHRIHPEDIAAIFIQAPRSHDLSPPPREYLPRLAKMAKEYGILLVDCETFTSPGRCGRWFSLDTWDVKADIYILGEGFSNGIPLGVLIAQDKVMDWDPGLTPVYGITPILGMHTAIKVMDIIVGEQLITRALDTGRRMIRFLSDSISELQLDVRVDGLGLNIGLDLGYENARKASILSLYRGLIVKDYGTGVLRITPTLDISGEVLSEGLSIMIDVFKILKESM
ncbi:MAG: aminotransferase class III-fold pyridoxal phosphate-dependent enzyme [Nitrososphaerota archaeon]|nr:aminotransferase class III-fold pyridoxal phosphate-dependent enzyme [Candidatus Bathyarchaeota archaeon]MCX8161452.1 aminotransferase class III-fold pyridoxal phosphate-dependent enzyme [Candidatus Bathyarchaeota archaeon]MDW8061912.1 aminotransferase class III-fold pyridoxal phosphate-dependent enzyme [Nitrososphaerota archaeon]